MFANKFIWVASFIVYYELDLRVYKCGWERRSIIYSGNSFKGHYFNNFKLKCYCQKITDSKSCLYIIHKQTKKCDKNHWNSQQIRPHIMVMRSKERKKNLKKNLKQKKNESLIGLEIELRFEDKTDTTGQ